MQLKCTLHVHTGEDPHENISYSAVDFLHAAHAKGFNCVAITCHNTFIYNKNIQAAADRLGILLIPGIEATIRGKHVLILNANPTAEKIKTFTDLKAWRAAHPESFIIAPHPFFHTPTCLGRHLISHIDCFDGIERSFFCLTRPNRKAEKISHKYGLPFIATADIHLLEQLELGYFTVEVSQKTIPALFSALRKSTNQNHFTHIDRLNLARLYAKMLRS